MQGIDGAEIAVGGAGGAMPLSPNLALALAAGRPGGGHVPQVKPNPEDDPEGQLWDRRIADAKKKWDSERDVRERFVRFFRTGRWEGEAADVKPLSVNLVFSYVASMTALLVSSLPQGEVDERMPELGDPGIRAFAEAMEKWLSYSLEETRSSDAHEVATFRALLMGLAWTKESYDPQRRSDVVDALSCLEVHVDPFATYSLSQARYMIQRVVQPVDEARRFFNRNDIAPNYTLAEERGALQRGEGLGAAADKDFLCYFECWCKKGDERLVYYRMPEGAGGEARSPWLAQGRWPFRLDGDEWPFTPWLFNSDHTKFDGFSEQSVTEGLLREFGELVAFDFAHAKRAAATKLGVDVTQLNGEEQLDALESPKDFEIVKFKSPPGEATHLFDFNRSTDEQQEMYSRAKGLYEEVLGFDELQRAANQKKLTATQAEILEEYGKLRIGRRQSAVDKALTTSLRHRAQIARQLVAPEDVLKACGPQAAQAFAQYAGNAEDLVREYSIQVRAGSSSERWKNIRIKQAQDNLALMQSVNDARIRSQMPPAFDVLEAALEILRVSKERRPERYVLPPPAPPPQVPGVPAGPGGVPVGPDGQPLPAGAPV